MASLNLLPTEQVRNREVTVVGNRLKAVVAVLGLVCLVLGIGGTALVLVTSNTITSLQKDQENLKSQVLAQESSEQALILVRDRLTKIKTLKEQYQNNTRFLAQREVVDALPENVLLKQLTITNSDSNLAVVAADSASMADVISLVKGSPLKDSIIDTISYSAGIGYTINFKK